jgi:hypothetical protein
MSIAEAYKILQIDTVSKEDLKRQYRKMALIYHPDKNPGEDASAQFQEINAAYHYLLPLCEDADLYESAADLEEDESKESYSHLLFHFLKRFNRVSLSAIQNELFYKVVEKIGGACREKVLCLLEKLDKSILIKIYEIFKEHREVLHFSAGLIDEIEEIIRRKIENTESIVLNPFLEDLLESNLYKLTVDGVKYIIPLWHSELVYDHSGNDLQIICNPILPDYMYLDAKNNLHLQLTVPVEKIWKSIKETSGNYTFSLTEDENHMISISGKSIVLDCTKSQTFVFHAEGIARVDHKKIYNIGVRGDIIIYLTLI